MKKIILFTLFVIGISYIFADCDMMAMIAKEGYLIYEITDPDGDTPDDFDDPIDYFDYIRERSTNTGSKPNPDGYGIIYYPVDGSWYYNTLDPDDPDNQASYLTGFDSYYYVGTTYNTNSPNNTPLNNAEDWIMNEDNEASIAFGHARQTVSNSGYGSHPFIFSFTGDNKTYTLMHNGTLTSSIKNTMYNFLVNEQFLTEYPSMWDTGNNYNSVDDWIDSEVLFRYLMYFIEENNENIVAGIHDALTQDANIKTMLQNPTSYPSYNPYTYTRIANFVLSDGENLYIFRNSPSCGQYYPDQDTWHNLSYEENDDIIYLKTLDDLDTRIDQFDFVVISKDESPIEYPNFLDSDAKIFSPGVTWVSFPRLTQQGTYNGNMFEQAYYDNGLPGLLQETSGGGPIINDFDIIYGYRNGDDIEIDYDAPDFIDLTGFDNMLFRHEGYKIEVSPGADQTILTVDGDRLESYSLDMTAMEYYWLGYYIPYPQNIEIAFGEDFWSDVNKVWAEDWFYDKMNNNRGIGEPELPANSTTGKTLEYGKMYIVQMYRNTDDFSWNGSSTVEEPEKKSEAENFSYTEKADYEAIDIIGIPENVTEIGVFEEDICVGAIVVTDSCEQMLAYTTNANREQIPLTFELVVGSRGFTSRVKNYKVLNQLTGQFESNIIIAGRQDYSAITLGEYNENPTPEISKVQLHNNYPNPFNPVTNISFSIPTEQKTKLTIYNLKGQKVRELVNGQMVSGTHSVIWNGTDDNGKQVGSGLYFYKLKTGHKEISKKMLLLK